MTVRRSNAGKLTRKSNFLWTRKEHQSSLAPNLWNMSRTYHHLLSTRHRHRICCWLVVASRCNIHLWSRYRDPGLYCAQKTKYLRYVSWLACWDSVTSCLGQLCGSALDMSAVHVLVAKTLNCSHMVERRSILHFETFRPETRYSTILGDVCYRTR